MRHFAAYYAGVYSYNDTSKWFHPWFPSYNPPYRVLNSSAGKYAGEDNGWVLALIYPAVIDFDKSIMKYPVSHVTSGAPQPT